MKAVSLNKPCLQKCGVIGNRTKASNYLCILLCEMNAQNSKNHGSGIFNGRNRS